jgi:hypothetical protein
LENASDSFGTPGLAEFFTKSPRRSSPVLETVVRAVFCRQHEALSAIPKLHDLDRGYLGALLLRSACEELIFVSYLAKIDRAHAERLVTALGRLDAAKNLKAQLEFGGEEAMREIGFSARFLRQAELAGVEAKSDLEELADVLGLPKSRQAVPSVRSLAERAGLLAEYDFLYHATSRFVHFNVNELMRRAWGRPGSLTISSPHFGDHWLIFSAYWGLWIHVGTTVEVLELIEGTPDDVLKEQELFAAVKQFGPRPPLVTAEEFDRPGRRPPWE